MEIIVHIAVDIYTLEILKNKFHALIIWVHPFYIYSQSHAPKHIKVPDVWFGTPF